MSLDFNGWANWAGEESDFVVGDSLYPEVESVIFHTMFVGVPQITDATVREFWNRAVLLSRVRYQQDPFFSEDLLRKMIGLRTNASPITRAAFNRKVLAGFWDGRV